MAENAGRIEYDFVADTTGVLKAESVVDKSTTNMANDFKKVDKAAATTSTQMTKAAAGVKKGVQANLGQAGIQVQQFVGQLQGGQSAMVALAQQSADLGIVLGAPLIGVFVSLAAVLAGTLLPSLMSNKTSADALEKSIEKVKAVMTVGADGVANYADEMKELNKVSQQLAKIKLAEAIINQNEVIKNSAKAIIESAETTSKAYKSTFSELRSLTESVAKDIGGDMNDVAEAIRGGQNIGTAGSYLNRDLDLIAKKFEITRSEALDLGLAMSDVIKKGDAVSIKSLQNVTEDLAESYGYSNDKITKLASGMVKYFIASNQATDGVNELRMALFGEGQEIGKNTETTKNATSTAASMALSLIEQKIALEQGERAALSFRLQLDGLTEAQKQHILSLYDANKATEASIEASKESSKALEAEIDAYIKIGEEALKAEEKKEAAAQRERDRLAERGATVGLTEVQTIEMKYENDLNALKAYFGEDYAIKEEYTKREIELNRQKQEAIRGTQAETNQFMQNAFGNLDTQIAGTMASVVLGAQDGEDALKSLAKTILTQVVGAIIQQGIASAVASATAATGQTAANAAILSTAAPAAAAVSLATAGANAVPAVSGIAAVTAAVAGIGSLAGGRQYGGPVSNGMYRVNETGVPEVRSFGGKDYLMETQNAKITPLDKMQGGGGGMTVNVSNNTPYEVYVTQDQAANIANVQIGREAGKMAKGQGSMFKAVRSSTNAKGNARN